MFSTWWGSDFDVGAAASGQVGRVGAEAHGWVEVSLRGHFYPALHTARRLLDSCDDYAENECASSKNHEWWWYADVDAPSLA
ncbi:hypothetical protein HDE76_000653 [Rhodanobacter sp. ANJX3]|jgi:hypothetical protein|uniref:hypothetical protein n=1 Tax=unclassified Rhodanobacter TaxID=2621553 RepID=UPI0015C8A63F|nr:MULTISPECIES: hypothetical protein [unclassified Rhodanobacter]MBB5357471.1 hypothetical protein [Rhodanobacter sp. ANJX3]NYE27520.1 hypothetical protein [Rhodanobacter sp. K2T2]